MQNCLKMQGVNEMLSYAIMFKEGNDAVLFSVSNLWKMKLPTKQANIDVSLKGCMQQSSNFTLMKTVT